MLRGLGGSNCWEVGGGFNNVRSVKRKPTELSISASHDGKSLSHTNYEQSISRAAHKALRCTHLTSATPSVLLTVILGSAFA